MSSLWVESHANLRGHTRFRKLVRALPDAPEALLCGALHFLWHKTIELRHEGDITGWDADDIAEHAGWPYDAEPFVAALGKTGFIEYTADGRQILHDWHQYAKHFLDSLAKKETDRRRKAAWRESKRQKRDGVPGTFPDTGVTSGIVPSLTGPNRTGPVKDQQVDPGSDAVDEVYKRYKQCVQPRSRINPRKKIAARLKRFSVAELCQGIDNFAADAWWMEHNGTQGSEWFFESDKRSEQFLLMKPRVPGRNGMQLVRDYGPSPTAYSWEGTTEGIDPADLLDRSS